jgi:hypothetical protein
VIDLTPYLDRGQLCHPFVNFRLCLFRHYPSAPSAAIRKPYLRPKDPLWPSSAIRSPRPPTRGGRQARKGRMVATRGPSANEGVRQAGEGVGEVDGGGGALARRVQRWRGLSRGATSGPARRDRGGDAGREDRQSGPRGRRAAGRLLWGRERRAQCARIVTGWLHSDGPFLVTVLSRNE